MYKKLTLIALAPCLLLNAKRPELDPFDAMETRLQKNMSTMFQSMNEQFKKIQEELDALTSLKTPSNHNTFSDSSDAIIIQLIAPEDFKLNTEQLDLINDTTLSALLQDDVYTIFIGVSLERNIFTFNYKIEQQNKTTKKVIREYAFQRSVTGHPQFDKITAEYDEKEHILTLTIPKEQPKVENKRAITITHKK